MTSDEPGAMPTKDEWTIIAQRSADRADAASALVEGRLGSDCYDDQFYPAKLALWLYDEHEKVAALAAERDKAVDDWARSEGELVDALRLAEERERENVALRAESLQHVEQEAHLMQRIVDEHEEAVAALRLAEERAGVIATMRHTCELAHSLLSLLDYTGDYPELYTDMAREQLAQLDAALAAVPDSGGA